MDLGLKGKLALATGPAIPYVLKKTALLWGSVVVSMAAAFAIFTLITAAERRLAWGVS